MSKKLTPKTSTKKKPKSPSTKKKALVIITVVILGLASWLAVGRIQNHRAIEKERKQYAQTQQDLNQLVEVLNKGEPKPTLVHKVSSCYHRSNTNEFEQGAIVCSTGYSIVYGTSDQAEAGTTVYRLADYLMKDDSLKFNSQSTELAHTSSPTVLKSESYTDVKTKLNCGVTYTYYRTANPPYPDEFLKNSGSAQSLLLEISCGDKARAAYYNLQN